MKTLATLMLGVVLTGHVAPAEGKVIKVVPGPGTPLQDAIDVASPRDMLRLAPGIYPEAIVIAKPLRIMGPGGVLPGSNAATIDGGCGVPSAVTIASDDVRVQKVAVLGGSFAGVEVQGGDRVKLRVGGAPSCAGVQYGIRVLGTRRLVVERGVYVGFSTLTNEPNSVCDSGTTMERAFAGAALYVGGTPAGASGRILRNSICEAASGIVLENVADLPTGAPSMLVRSNLLYVNQRGIRLLDADGTAILANDVNFFPPLEGISGIDLDAGSDDNLVGENDIGTHVTDVSDLGSSNCWRRNEFATGSVPTTGCP